MRASLGWIGSISVLAACGLLGGRAWAEDGFTAATAGAMQRMDHGMMVAPSGDPDRDFATMMIPHHQGAIDMAEAELRYGRDPTLRRLARDIVAAQRREIKVMQGALGKLPPAAGAQAPRRD